MVSIICQYPYWQIRNYLQVPVLSNKKLFASTPCLVHYPRGRGNKMAKWKSCIGCLERFGVYISSGGVLANTHFAIFAIIVLSTNNHLQVPLSYDSRQIKLLTLSKTCQLEAGGYKVHICGRGGRIIVKTPAQLNTTSTAAGFYMKITLHPTPPRLPRNTILLQSWGD